MTANKNTKTAPKGTAAKQSKAELILEDQLAKALTNASELQTQYDLMFETYVKPEVDESARLIAKGEMIDEIVESFNKNEEDKITVKGTLQEIAKFLELDGIKEPLLIKRELNGFRQVVLWAIKNRNELGIDTNETGFTSSFGAIKKDCLPDSLKIYHESYHRCQMASEGQKVIFKADLAHRKKVAKTIKDYSDPDFIIPPKKR